MQLIISGINNRSNTNFTSLRNPVKQYSGNFNGHMITVTEETEDYVFKNKKISNIAKFFLDNFISAARDPFFAELKKPWNIKKYLRNLSWYKEGYKKILQRDEGLSTMLIAKDEEGNLAGAILTHQNDAIEEISDKQTLYINSIAINEKYRGAKLGSKLIEMAVNADKDYFSDIYLTSIKSAIPFYEKLGFNVMDLRKPENKFVISKIAENRYDFFIDMMPMEKVLNPQMERWVDRINREKRFNINF